MKVFYVIFLLLLSNICLSQEAFKEASEKYSFDTTKVKVVNKSVLQEIISTGSSKVYWVGIFVNDCIGTPAFLENMNVIKKIYKKNLGVMLCSSEKYKYVNSMLKVLNENSFDVYPVYMIDRSVYKEKANDSRYKGYEFRNDICEACKNIVIGVPFSVFFDKSGKVIKYGYLRKSEILEFLEGVMKK